MRIHFSSILIGLMLVATVTVPSLGYLAFATSSMSAGVLLISGLYIFLYVALYSVQRQSHSLGTIAIPIAVVLGVIITQSAISFLINDVFDYGRFLKSNMLLIIYLLGAFSFAVMAQEVPNLKADFVVKLVFYVLILSAIAGSTGYSPFSANARKAVLFFNEPSHFALSFLPFLLYMTVTASPRMKLPLLLLGYTIALLLENLTLVIGTTLAFALGLRLKQLVLLTPIAALVILFVPLNLDYYSMRLDLSSEVKTLSSLVYLSGWERAYLNLKDTLGLGVGFQQFGIIGRPGDMMESIVELVFTEVNELDGGAVAPKFIGEFGFLGVTMLLVYLFYFAKSARWLHDISMLVDAPRDYSMVFFNSCFVMYSIDLFVRGISYFTTSGFLFIAAFMWVAKRKSVVIIRPARNLYRAV